MFINLGVQEADQMRDAVACTETTMTVADLALVIVIDAHALVHVHQRAAIGIGTTTIAAEETTEEADVMIVGTAIETEMIEIDAIVVTRAGTDVTQALTSVIVAIAAEVEVIQDAAMSQRLRSKPASQKSNNKTQKSLNSSKSPTKMTIEIERAMHLREFTNNWDFPCNLKSIAFKPISCIVSICKNVC